MQIACRILNKCFNAITGSVWPRCCPVCACSLTDAESLLCLDCLSKLPRTQLHREDFNILHQQTGSHVAVDKAMAWFWYFRGNEATNMIIDAKYHDRPGLLREAARCYCKELAADQCPPDSFADLIVPMPMHWRKRMRRGYNQSEWMAKGISDETHLPVSMALQAIRPHRTQTRLNATQRARNLADSISLVRPDEVRGMKVLLVDDIITTGATMQVALQALASGHPSSISILALGAAKKA